MSSFALSAAFCIFVLLILRRLFSPTRSTPLPPGPRGLPFIGSLLDMPSKEQWLTFSQWGATYGDITYIEVLERPIVILNSAQIASDLLDKRSGIYSDRPVLHMAGKLVGYDRMLGIIPYGDRFRSHRRMFQQSVGTRALVERFLPVEEEEMHHLLRRILNTPDNLFSHIALLAGAVTLRISHGYKPREENDPFVELGREMMSQFSQAVAPGTFLVDVIPALRYLPDWFPGAKFKTLAKQWAVTHTNTMSRPYEYAKQQLKSGTADVSCTSHLLDATDISPQEEEDVKWTGAGMIAGGVDTTAAAIAGFFLAMSLYPEVQRRAQAELAAVVGNDRLPSFADRPYLPYIEAVSLEVLRWHVAAPTAIPHLLTKDDIYNGYFLPKGTTVIANVWGLLHDPRLYPDPTKFDPSRFIGTQPQRDPRDFCFGFGRRACPGKLLADSTVFICCAMNLAAFNISKHVENGTVVEPVVRQLSGVVSYPTPFKCTVVARSEKAAALIQAGSM